MARYNTVISSTSGSLSGATLASPSQGQFTELTGTGPYSVTVPLAPLYNGVTQVFYNKTGSVVSLLTGTGANFIGPAASGTGTQALPNGSTVQLVSDGTDYVVVTLLGGPLSASTLTASSTVTLSPANANVVLSPTGSGVVTVNPATTGSIDNMIIGGTTAKAGAFTSVSTNVASANSLSVTGGVATAYNTATAALLVTGGLGVSGAIYGNGVLSTTGLITSTASSGLNAITSSSQGTTATSTSNAFNVAGGIGCGGTIYTVGLVETSSIAFKENINPITGALDAILKLTGVTYDRKDNKKHEAGLIAEHVFKHVPELVALDDKGNPYGIHYTKVSAYLIECIKTLQEEINELKGKAVATKTTITKKTKGSN